MFTGIIQDVGVVRRIEKSGDWRIEIQTAMDLSRTVIGASIACSGCCLTVIEKGADWFAVQVSGESLAKTVIGEWAQGARVNLEPALKVGDELGGHMVSGHVDGLAAVVGITKVGDSHRVSFKVQPDHLRFIAPKGSITLDGVSLTVNDVRGDVFEVNLVPHTWGHTTLGGLETGQWVNIEIDMLARYVARMMDGEMGQAA